MALLNCKINYILYTGNNKEIEKEVEANYIPGKLLEFEENVIDLINKTYSRKTNEYEMIISFATKMCELKYDEEHSFKFDIESFFKTKNDLIHIEYAFDEEIKKLIINLKEVNL